MKKFLAMFLAACLCVSLAACDTDDSESKVPLGEHKHVYTTKSACDLCGEVWNATETDAYTFTPVTLNGVVGYDVTFGTQEIRYSPIDPTTGREDFTQLIVETRGKPFEEPAIVLPCVHEGKPVISVGREFAAFSETVKRITIPDSIFSYGRTPSGIYYGAFGSCINLEEIVFPYEPNFATIGYSSDVYPISVASLLGGPTSSTMPICEKLDRDGYIGEYLFTLPKDAENFTIKEGTKGIAENALINSKLEEIHIPDSVIEIGDGAFVGVGGPDDTPLKKVTFGENSKLKRIGAYAFNNCRSLKEIDLPDGLEEIGYDAFAMTGLTNITIPNSVKRIGQNVFYNTPYEATNIKTWINENVMQGDELYIGTSLIKLNPDVEGVYTVRKDTTAIAGGAFSQCKVTSVILPEGMTVIEDSLFSHSCIELIRIPKSVKDIGAYAFQNCQFLESINIPEGITVIREGTFAGSALKNISLPSTLREIGNGAFGNLYGNPSCINLQSITIPDGVTTIGQGAFCGCRSLQKIVIPKSVTSIGMSALLCGALEDIEFGGTVKEWQTLFEDQAYSWVIDTQANLTVHCSDGTLDKDGNPIV